MITEGFLLTAAWVIITLLLGVIAVFLKRLLIRFDIMNETLQDVVLKNALQGTTCILNHKGVDARLNAHSEKIKEIENRLNNRKNEK